MHEARDIIIKPLVTEKSTAMMEAKKYVFQVALRSNKIQIKNAIEHLFQVKVKSVNTIHMPGKFKRMGVHSGYRPDWKKAIVTLEEGSKSIEIFEGL